MISENYAHNKTWILITDALPLLLTGLRRSQDSILPIVPIDCKGHFALLFPCCLSSYLFNDSSCSVCFAEVMKSAISDRNICPGPLEPAVVTPSTASRMAIDCPRLITSAFLYPLGKVLVPYVNFTFGPLRKEDLGPQLKFLQITVHCFPCFITFQASKLNEGKRFRITNWSCHFGNIGRGLKFSVK